MEERPLTRRQFLRGAAVTVTGAMLAACGSTPVPTPTQVVVTKVVERVVTPTPLPAKQKITLRLQEKAPVQAWYEKLLFPIFMDKYPWIKVEFEPRVEGWVEKNLTMMAAGTAPEIIHAYGEIFGRYSSKKQLLDLTPLIDKDMTKAEVDDQMPFQWKALYDPFKKVRVGLGRQVDMHPIYYNKDMFDKAGVAYPTDKWTYDDWRAASMKLVVKDGSGKIKTWGTYSRLALWSGMGVHVNAFGGHVRDEQTWMKCLLHEKPAKDFFEWQRAMIFDDKSCINDTTIAGFGTASVAPSMFAAGLFAIAELNQNDIGTIANEAKFRWNMTHPPVGPAGRVGLADNDGFCIYKGVEKKGADAIDACWKLLRFMNGPFFQRTNMEQTGEFPGLQSLVKEYEEVVKRKFPGTKEVDVSVAVKAVQMQYLVSAEFFRYQAEASPIVVAARQRLWEVGDAKVDILDKVSADVDASQAQAFNADPDK